MKKLIGIISGFTLSLLPLSFAFADNLCPNGTPTADFSLLCKTGAAQFGSVLGRFITLIFIVVTIVALFYLIWGGFKWLTSGGDSKAVDTARGHIIAAIIGLIIVFLAYFILNFVIGFFVPGFSFANFDLSAFKIFQ